MEDSERRHSALDSNAVPRLGRYLLLALLGTLPVIALALYSYHIASRALERHIAAGNRNSAQITRGLVERDFANWVTTLGSFSRMPEVTASVAARDEDALRRNLAILVESKPRVVRAFVTDSSGLLWSDYPRAPESLGRRFDHRDWYRGLSASWRPYVSRVYRRHAAPRPLLVAIAAPVRESAEGPVIGAVVYQVRLEGLTELLRRVEVGSGGFVFLLDHAGVVAAHPRLDLQAREYSEYGSVEPIRATLNGRASSGRYTDPLTDEPMVAAAVPAEVQGHRWVVVAQQPVAAAYGTIQTLGWQIAGAGLLLTIVVAGLFFGLAKSNRRIKTMNRRLEVTNERLSHENAERVRAERALQRSHDDLEQRVEERTRELRQKEEQLLHAQKMEAVGRLAGGIAHDFNNILSVIIGYAELVLDDLPEDAPFRREIQEILDAGERADALTGQLLAFSRKQVLKPRILDLNRIVTGMDRMLRRIIGEDIDLVTNLDPDLDPVKADPGKIEQIMVNLAVNARDAMPEGGKMTIETADVELDEEYVRSHDDARPGPHVMLAMTDTGIGMDAETQARIFEPFFTTKGRDRGTGLGLSTVYGIVKQSGGNIWVYSEVDRGTTFKIYLPATREEVTPDKPRRTEPMVPTGSETILVVEDEPSLRRLILAVLRGSGYTVLAAGDAEEALELAEAHDGPIHLLLTDVVLPGPSGPRLAEELTERRPSTGVLFMSGYTDKAIVHHGVLAEGTAFIEKPFRPDTLLHAVREALAGAAPQ